MATSDPNLAPETVGPRIRILEESVANKIAAGEVVERPASVVKELVENAIDAGATRIHVEVEQGGRRLLRVADNGCGMTAEEAVLSLQRHATSKISDEKDLYEIRTLGFRGEALPSIASVSKMTITTATAGAGSGTRLVCHGGSIDEMSEVGAPQGTDLVVADLFYNVPARYKFLRAPSTELNHISNLMVSFSISHHHIGFKLKSEGRETFSAPATERLQDAVARAFPRESDHLIPVESQVQGVRLTGLTSLPHCSRSNRTGQMLFVNGRNVRSRAISQAIVSAYQTYLKRDEYPVCVLLLEIDPRIIDVNVHPAKAEVKFADERGAQSFVMDAVRSALDSHYRPVSVADPGVGEFAAYRTETNADSVSRSEPHPAYPSLQPSSHEPTGRLRPPYQHVQGVLGDLGPGDLPSTKENVIAALRPLAQTQVSWIICESPDGLVLVDPHAAHERILYEEQLKRGHPAAIQGLLSPESVTLGRVEADAVSLALPVLARIGFDVEEFGPNTFLIRAVPAEGGDRAAAELFDEVVHELVGFALQEPSVRPGPDEQAARCACKLATKLGDTMVHAEMVELLRRLSQVDNAYTCPHGRPTMFTISNDFIEQRFRRR